MKKVNFIFALLMVLLVLAGCTSESGGGSVISEAYKNAAQNFLDAGDLESAIEVLNEGIKATQDETLKAMLEEVAGLDADAKTAATSDNSLLMDDSVKLNAAGMEDYIGTWAECEIFWIYGGLILDIAESNENMILECTYTQSAPDSRVASFSESVALSKIKNNAVTVEFEDDGWGNAGTLVLEFCGSEIRCEIKDTYYAGDEVFAIWGIAEGQYYLYRNDEAHEMMTYDIDEYYELFPENNPDNWEEQTPVYDTSTASGILRSIGMTEEEFRASCQRLFSNNVQIGTPDGTEAYYSELAKYPSNYIGRYFVIDNLSSCDFECSYKGISNDGYPYYEDSDYYSCNAIIYDFRDDVYSPNIQNGDVFTPYVIFKGIRTVNGNDWLVFWMISVDN